VSPAGVPILLASHSPQRRAILTQLGIAFDQMPTDVDELREGDPEDVVVENAMRKARAASAAAAGRVVLGVDTEVFLEGELFGKAADEARARAHLERLSGRTHEVFSGLALLDGNGECTAVARTAVTFRTLDDRTVDWYVSSGEWAGRAGAYAVQGRGAALVERIEGDYWNVVGLPVPLLLSLAPWLLA
jgi:septum formation protein